MKSEAAETTEAEARAEKQRRKLETNARQAAVLMGRLYGGKAKTLRDMVASVLNRFPETRADDRALHATLLKEYFGDLVDAAGRIHVDDIKKVVRLHLATRERAHIQYDLGLFQAPPDVAAFRKRRAAEMTDEYGGSAESSRVVTVYADESGKTDEYLVFGSIWVYRPAEVDRIERALKQWREEHGVTQELHFTRLGKGGGVRGAQAVEFFARALEANPFGACIALAVRNQGISAKERSASIYSGFAEMIIAGLRSEITSGRLTAPVNITVFKDADVPSDELQLAQLKRRVRDAIRSELPNGEAELINIVPLDSHDSDLVQVSDLFTGAVSRYINTGMPELDGNEKEQFAARAGAALGFFQSEGRWRCLKDPSKILYLGEQS